jgi:hypothetical protein
VGVSSGNGEAYLAIHDMFHVAPWFLGWFGVRADATVIIRELVVVLDNAIGKSYDVGILM